ncbi:hypothetical protein D6789_02330 [Candidatus Woesearchaeota archaeon]|nr:MAG: hypothetical protein D6789_02330 [Candidatus Woesearchaeota archaeon]
MDEEISVEEIIRFVQQARELAESQLPMLEGMVTRMVACREQSVRGIEQLLDVLLDYQYLGLGTEAFHRLNRYYATLHPQYAAVYEQAAKEIGHD